MITSKNKNDMQKKEDSKRKKAQRDNLDDSKKEKLRKYEKGVKEVMHVNFDVKKKI